MYCVIGLVRTPVAVNGNDCITFCTDIGLVCIRLAV